jgi:hypothetical protein
MLQETKDRKEISATSYNKSRHATRDPLPDSKTKKKILI